MISMPFEILVSVTLGRVLFKYMGGNLISDNEIQVILLFNLKIDMRSQARRAF